MHGARTSLLVCAGLFLLAFASFPSARASAAQAPGDTAASTTPEGARRTPAMIASGDACRTTPSSARRSHGRELVRNVFRGTQTSAVATIATFFDKAGFILSTGAIPLTGPLPNLGEIAGGLDGEAMIGSTTFSIAPPSINFYVGTGGLDFPDWYPPLLGNELAISGSENLNVQFIAPVYSAGFVFVEPDLTMPVFDSANFPTSDGLFTETLFRDGLPVASFDFNAPDDIIYFVGVWSDAPFDRVEVREVFGGIDDEYFGEFYAGHVPPVDVPEEAGLAFALDPVRPNPSRGGPLTVHFSLATDAPARLE